MNEPPPPSAKQLTLVVRSSSPRGAGDRKSAEIVGVGSGMMFGVRYVVAVLVGLAVGAAAGWISGREFEPGRRVAPGP